MRNHVVTGIDIGTYHVKVVIAEINESGAAPRIIGTGFSKSRGLRHGYIMNSTDISKSLQAAIIQAQNDSGTKVREAYISFNGVGLEEVHTQGKTAISRSEYHVAESDIQEAIKNAKRSVKAKLVNKKIIHEIPITYTLDGNNVFGSPLAMQGSELVVDILFITALEQHLTDLVTTIEDAGIEVIETIAAPIAASLVTLNKTQKMAGCVLANIGAETVSIAVFENNTPISVKVFPVGSSNITNDIALGLKIPLIEAEQIKLGSITGTDYPRKKLEDITASRVKDIFKLIDNHLKSIGKAELLPAGVILTGGGSETIGLEELAKSVLKLPSELAPTRIANQTLKDSAWAVGYGLCILAANNTNSSGIFGSNNLNITSSFAWLKKFLP